MGIIGQNGAGKTSLLKLLAGIGILILLFLFKVKIGQVAFELRFSHLNWILLAASLHVIGLLISAYRWQLLLSTQEVHAPLWQLLQSYLIGGFFNNFLPTRVGGDVYRMADSRKYRGSLLRPAAGDA